MRKLIFTAFLFFGLTTVLNAQSGWDAHLAKLTSAIKCNAGLFGLTGEQWAGAASLPLPVDEVKFIATGFSNTAQLFANGPKINGIKYMTLKADDNLIILKRGEDGVVCKKSMKAVTICKFSYSAVTLDKALTATTSFADYLKGIGY